MANNTYVVIMAGGIGSRFWPMSRTSRPKQFLDILGTGRTLIQLTYDRFSKLAPPENMLVVSNRDYKELIMEQLPDISEQNILLEPMRRNTAPCIAYANMKIELANPDANIIVTPADHIVLNENKFVEDMTAGVKFIEENDALLTLGITPSRPETGYGYIQVDNQTESKEGIQRVKTFTEKPNHDLAKVFLESGEFFWNSGMFLWSLKTINAAFDTLLPDVMALFRKDMSAYNTSNEEEYINETYTSCQNISIDYGVMEHAKNVNVLCTEFGWSDLGTWGSLHENSKHDPNENTIQASKALCYDTKNTLVRIEGDKLAVVQGLDDYIVVDSGDVLLICKKHDEQKIKEFVNDIKVEYGKQYD